MMLNRIITLTSLGGGLVAIIVSIMLGSYSSAIVAAILFLIALTTWKYGYLFVPYITSGLSIIEKEGPYTISKSRDYIVKKTEEGYLATKYLEVLIYESTTDKTKEEKEFLFESFERALRSLKHTVKITFMLSPIDVSKHIEEIKTKRSEAEAKKAKLHPQSPESIKLDREIAMWNRLLNRLSSGERPMEVIIYASTTAFGSTQDEAVALVKRQAREIKTILSSTLSAEVKELKDLDMIKCFEWDFFAPPTHEALVDEVF